MSQPMRSTRKSPVSPDSREQYQQQRSVSRNQSGMAGGLHGWFIPSKQPVMTDESNGSPGLVSRHSGPWPPYTYSDDDKGRNHNSPQGSGHYRNRISPEFRQWPGQSQYQSQSQVIQRTMPYVVHDNRTYIGNDWQCANGTTPRISQTISSYYMGAPLPQAPMLYRNEAQEYQEHPSTHAYSDILSPSQGAPRFQPSRHSQRIPPPQPLEDNNPPPYQKRSNPNRHRNQRRDLPSRCRATYNKFETPILDELDTMIPVKAQVAANRHPKAHANYTPLMRPDEAVGTQGVSTLMPMPMTAYDESTSKEHFNKLMSRLRSFSVAPEQGKVRTSSYLPNTQRTNVRTPTTTLEKEIILSGKELFEKAKAEDKTGKYDNCYWDDRMDCFVNKGAGDIGQFWK